MAISLYQGDGHQCLMFEDLVSVDSAAIQSNQFFIASDGHLALIDPGGVITYNAIFMEKQRRFPGQKLDYVIASHADPDIVASANKWLVQTDCKLIVPHIWARFVPHFCTASTEGRIIAIPDAGMDIRLGRNVLKALPAHFLHSEGNFNFYDPISKILFSGDMGASFGDVAAISTPVTDFDSHVPSMLGFHRRYMSSNKVCRFWVNMVRRLDIEWIVPQHGRSFRGKVMVNRFLEWVDSLRCGVDLMVQEHYAIPNMPAVQPRV